MTKRIFIIAEAGVNHNGSVQLAMRLVDCAKKAGADAIKFQTFKADLVASSKAPTASYQKRSVSKNESQLEMLKRLELKDSDFYKLSGYCRKKKIMFLSTAFDLESLDLLVRLGLKTFKVPSGEITNLPYLRKIGSLHKKIILSTGMATLKEIQEALDVLIKSGTRKKDITILHCNTEYPTPFKDVNLLAMLTIKDKLGIDVGYSDHTSGVEVSIAAAALGASVIEKHFTLAKSMPGPDHKASLDPNELKVMVDAIRNIEAALGSGIKQPSSSEQKNISIVRRSIVAAQEIRKGDTLNLDNIIVKRPGSGISPMKWDEAIGKKAKKNFKKDELIIL